MSFVVKGKRGLSPEPRDIPVLVIGSRSTTHLPVDDPTVADKHCAIHSTEAGYEIEDLGSSSGTYLNGVEVTERKSIPKDGGMVVIGHSRIALAIDGESKDLVLSLKEGSFFFDRRNDPFEWVKSEVVFGRSRSVRAGIYFSTLLALLFFVGVAMSPDAPDALQPGSLIAIHSEALHDADFDSACDACHDPYVGVTVERCEKCHRKKMADGSRFPFWTAAEWRGNGRGCQECHLEHQGADFAGMKPEDFRLIWSEGPGEAARAPAVATPGARIPVPVIYDTFSHEQHVLKKLVCTECHHRAEENGNEADEPIRREFERIRFEDCMGCHDPLKTESPAEVRFSVAWHGTDHPRSNCTGCHVEKHAAVRRIVSREKPRMPGRTYEYTSRSHAEQASLIRTRQHPPVPENRRCEECHKDGRFGGVQRLGPFRHFTHLTGLGREHVGECTKCHKELDGAQSLARGRPAVPPGKSCDECHGKAVPTRAHTDLGELRAVIDFPHGVHVKSKHADFTGGSCHTCHELPAAGPGGLDAFPGTSTDIADCSRCHTNHERVGMVLVAGMPMNAKGDCARCHLKGDPAWFGPKGNPEAPLTKPWPAKSGFSHYSGGHAESTARDCTICHPAVSKARNLQGVLIPDDSEQVCRDCHEKTMFHRR